MSQAAIDLFCARAVTEEGVRLKPYDDRTGRPVVAPQGKLSWGIGFNLLECGSVGLFKAMLSYLCQDIDRQLVAYPWYVYADSVRQSVFVDMAYNEGVHGLVDGFPHMIAAIPDAQTSGDWTLVVAQCKVLDAKLDTSRYAPLRKLLQTGIVQ